MFAFDALMSASTSLRAHREIVTPTASGHRKMARNLFRNRAAGHVLGGLRFGEAKVSDVGPRRLPAAEGRVDT